MSCTSRGSLSPAVLLGCGPDRRRGSARNERTSRALLPSRIRGHDEGGRAELGLRHLRTGAILSVHRPARGGGHRLRREKKKAPCPPPNLRAANLAHPAPSIR